MMHPIHLLLTTLALTPALAASFAASSLAATPGQQQLLLLQQAAQGVLFGGTLEGWEGEEGGREGGSREGEGR
jgi:hypothetical protein